MLKCILSLKSYAWLVQFMEQPINKSTPYGHLVPIKEKQLRESFQNDWPIIALPLVYQIVSEPISEHIVISE